MSIRRSTHLHFESDTPEGRRSCVCIPETSPFKPDEETNSFLNRLVNEQLSMGQYVVILLSCDFVARHVGRAITRSSLEREVCGSNLRPVKSKTVLPTACHCFDISKKAVLPWHNDAEMDPKNWWWWNYPTPSEGWGRGGTPRRPNSRATPQGLDHRSRIEREEPKIDLRRGSEAGQSRRR